MACAFIPACHLLAREARKAYLAQPAKANIAKFATNIPKHETNIAKFGTFVSRFAISQSCGLVGRGAMPLKKGYKDSKGKARRLLRKSHTGHKGRVARPRKEEEQGHERRDTRAQRKRNTATRKEPPGHATKASRVLGRSIPATEKSSPQPCKAGCGDGLWLRAAKRILPDPYLAILNTVEKIMRKYSPTV